MEPVWEDEEEKGEVVFHVSDRRGGERAKSQSMIGEKDQHRVVQITVLLHTFHQAAVGYSVGCLLCKIPNENE